MLFSRQRTPLLLALFGGAGLFIGLKWRAVKQSSEAAKKAGTTDVNYSVATGRSGEFLFFPSCISILLLDLLLTCVSLDPGGGI